MWNNRYSRDIYVYGTKPNSFLSKQASRLPAGDILCIGAGEGRNAVYLAGLGHNVWALDSSGVGLEKARVLATKKGVKINTIHADLATYDFGTNQWNAIVSIFCHLPSPLRVKVHKQIFKALRPEGLFILEAYTPDQLQYGTGGPSNAGMMMTLAFLQDELTGLNFEVAQEVVRDIHEGEGHNGTGATVQILAQKTQSFQRNA